MIAVHDDSRSAVLLRGELGGRSAVFGGAHQSITGVRSPVDMSPIDGDAFASLPRDALDGAYRLGSSAHTTVSPPVHMGAVRSNRTSLELTRGEDLFRTAR